MSRRTLGSLASAINVAGAEAVNNTVGPERTPLERQALRMYERQHEAWRPLNHGRMTTFIEMFLTAMVHLENAYHDGRRPPATASILITTLRRRIIPFIHKRLVWTMDDSQWPMSLEHFEELDMFLAGYLPRLRATPKWDMIRFFFNEVKKQRQQQQEEQELTEEEAGERNYLEWKNSAEYNMDYSNDDD